MVNRYIKHAVLFFNLFFLTCGLVKSESDDYDYSSFELELDQLPTPDLLEKLITETDVSVFDHVNLPS